MFVKILDTHKRIHMGPIAGLDQLENGLEISLASGYKAKVDANDNTMEMIELTVISGRETRLWEFRTKCENGICKIVPMGPNTTYCNLPFTEIKFEQAVYFIQDMWQHELNK